MKVWKRSLPVWLLTLVMLLTACGTPSQPDQPDGTETWREAYEETGAYLQAQTAPTVGSIGGEWAVIGLSRAGLLSDETAQSYEQTVEDYVKPPLFRWRAHAHLLYENWLNYYVYQNTPYDLGEIQRVKHE